MRITLLQSGSSEDSNLLLDALRVELRPAKVATISLFPTETDSSVPIPRADVTVLEDKISAGLERGKRLYETGVLVVSPYLVTVLYRGKLRANQVLARAGLPIPEYRPVTGPEDLLPMLADGLVIPKPRRGSHGRGVQVIHDSTDVPVLWETEEMFAQRYYESETLDRKIYRIGEDVFCVERVWPPATLGKKRNRLIELDATIRELTMECGWVLGTGVHGVDVIEHKGRPWVVDLSSFPGFKGVSEAGVRIAEMALRMAVETRKDDTPLELIPDNGTPCPVP